MSNPLTRRGYACPLYLLPFDHRHSYVAGMFHLTAPLTAQQHRVVADSKRVIYDGFREAAGCDVPIGSAGVLVDEEFGAEILRDAAANGHVTALPVEKSGSAEFELEYGEAFAQHIAAFSPTFAKALVRYNPEDDPAINDRQIARLRRLSDYCQSTGQLFMFELLVPPTAAQRHRAEALETDYDMWMRPELTVRAITTLQDAGIDPDIWKVEGLDRRQDCERIATAARRGGRDDVSCIVLGSGADPRRVSRWLETAASVAGFVGFAVGRTTFWDPIADFVAKRVTREAAVSRISRRFGEWMQIFERARARTRSAA
jgi:myo-inositol catabolism protein IolC